MTVSEIDRLSNSDDSWRWYARNAAARANEARWAIALEAQEVLREQGFLRNAATSATESAPAESADD